MNWTYDVELVQNEFIPWAPWNTPVNQCKVALVSMGGVYLKKGLHQPFGDHDPTFREFPSVVVSDDLELAQGGFDLGHARDDINVVFPLQRLTELAARGYIGSVAPLAYSMADNNPLLTPLLANFAPSLAYRMKRMGADLALLVATSPLGHQNAGLAARAIELAGVPTVVLGTHREVLESVKVPRSVVVQHPDGAPLGNPGNAGKHQHLLLEALGAAWEFEGPGLVAELAHAWSGR